MELTLKSALHLARRRRSRTRRPVFAYYVDARGTEVVDALNTEAPTKGVDDQIEEPSLLGSLLFSILPIIIILGLFWFLMGQMQGGGNRVMQFGKSRAKLATKDTPKVTFADVAGCDEAIEELTGDQGVPPGAGEVPRRRRQDPQGRAALRPARYRQDAARARRRR